ncbi:MULTISPECIES: hypothetical protein [unclassified Mesorhizobium]|uniref:hypothetical protein n=1 Tax=unclassified Mesorhizobium TaxID=325217 RepID=UPI0003CEF1B8|nr:MULTISPECIES: hypothetical protein [unclassified Mesorhizobium]ESY56615.1 hypothetical protein X745_06225 [Mesorhizobium sp. LNJC374B00]WJI80801.1 hypothetical protein NLY34_28940 [Mesorhizobium sp. C374B]WJI87340.1 hypothetical protein NLY42_31335 [Mesorhizobium sp. C372A]
MGWPKPFLAILVLCLCALPAAAGQSFSCSFGEPACLDYGAVVCKSGAQCVARDSVCFDSYTCDYKGFVCRSQFDKAVEEIDDKVTKFNALLATFNDLKTDYETASSQLSRTQTSADELVSCVRRATTLDEAQRCRM